MEEAIQLITRFYKAPAISSSDYMVQFKSIWEMDLGENFLADVWDKVWSGFAGCLFTNKATELQFMVKHRLQISLMKCNTFNPLLSK